MHLFLPGWLTDEAKENSQRLSAEKTQAKVTTTSSSATSPAFARLYEKRISPHHAEVGSHDPKKILGSPAGLGVLRKLSVVLG